MTTDLQVALAAARAGSEVVKRGYLSRPEVNLKGAVNPVTAVDEEAERAVFSTLGRLAPGEKVLGEESGGEGWDSDRVWIVDPLDGTVNFIHGLPQFSVSVALWEHAEPRVGVVIDVMRGEEFSAAAGEGAHLDGQSISVSQATRLGDALVATGFPYDRQEHGARYAATVGSVMGQVQGIRRIGSAALDMAWVACGRFDGYWEYSLEPWDMAAGALLVGEAGGRISDHRGGGFDLASRTIVASNGSIHDGLAGVVAANLPAHLE